MRPLGLALLLLTIAPRSGEGQIGLAIRGSTLGAGAELSFRAASNLGVRLGGNYLEFSGNREIEGIAYRFTPHFENGTAILDLYPFGGAFHFSGGLLLNYNQGRLTARLTENLEVGGQTYTPEQVGSLIGTVTFRRTAPYVGLGFAGQGSFGLVFDIGVGITGEPEIGLTGETNLTGAERAQFDANVEQERQQLEAEIERRKYLRFHPVVSFGFKIGF